jgi:hypothetical protein
MKNISQKRLNAKGDVLVRTFRGAKIVDLHKVFSSIKTPTPAIKRVVLHVGTNNTANARNVELDKLLAEYICLVDEVHSKLPEAKIAISSIPPSRPWTNLKTVRAVNMALQGLCADMRLTFLPHAALWKEDNNGKIDPTVLSDKVHLSQSGLGFLLRDIKAFLAGSAPSKPAVRDDASNHPSSKQVPSRSFAAAVKTDVVAKDNNGQSRETAPSTLQRAGEKNKEREGEQHADAHSPATSAVSSNTTPPPGGQAYPPFTYPPVYAYPPNQWSPPGQTYPPHHPGNGGLAQPLFYPFPVSHSAPNMALPQTYPTFAPIDSARYQHLPSPPPSPYFMAQAPWFYGQHAQANAV